MSNENERFFAEPYSEGLWRVTFRESPKKWHTTFIRAANEQEAIKEMMEQINEQ